MAIGAEDLLGRRVVREALDVFVAIDAGEASWRPWMECFSLFSSTKRETCLPLTSVASDESPWQVRQSSSFSLWGARAGRDGQAQQEQRSEAHEEFPDSSAASRSSRMDGGLGSVRCDRSGCESSGSGTGSASGGSPSWPDAFCGASKVLPLRRDCFLSFASARVRPTFLAYSPKYAVNVSTSSVRPMKIAVNPTTRPKLTNQEAGASPRRASSLPSRPCGHIPAGACA